MAISITNKDHGRTDTPGSSFATGSVAFQNNTLYLLAVYNRGTSRTVTGVSGGGLTWTLKSEATPSADMAIFEGWATSGASTGALTVSLSGSATAAAWVIDEATGIDTTTRIVQSPTPSTGTGTTGTTTLAAFGDATNNATWAAAGHNADEATSPEASPWAELADCFGDASTTPALTLETEWRVGQDTSPSATWAGSVAWAVGGVEIKAAAGGSTTTINVTTPGTVTWAGQTLGLKTSIATVAGAIAWAGATVALKNQIAVVPGNITWAGATDITVTAPGSTTTINVDTAGNVTWAGQALGLRTTVSPTAGAIAWAGQVVGLLNKIAPSAGGLTWTGQALGLKQTQAIVAGNVNWSGATDIVLVSSGAVTVGFILFGPVGL